MKVTVATKSFWFTVQNAHVYTGTTNTNSVICSSVCFMLFTFCCCYNSQLQTVFTIMQLVATTYLQYKYNRVCPPRYGCCYIMVNTVLLHVAKMQVYQHRLYPCIIIYKSKITKQSYLTIDESNHPISILFDLRFSNFVICTFSWTTNLKFTALRISLPLEHFG